MIKTKCPYCNYIATEHETLDYNIKPINEDISFCIECGEVSEYKNKKLIKISINNLDQPTKKEINNIRVAWLRVRARQTAQGKVHKI